eukprot:TRINITY_DN22966_c0_g1_i1.p1 TRINITY_DN22966_c0_g1~~TRINITY_DN22966_c0_g1_i1.p1  ORF type:complete len:318 (-),score=66.33 TRINITY_DN22966_c0_g1_i1:118-1071(-)
MLAARGRASSLSPRSILSSWKAVAIDMDGTTLNSSLTLSERTVDTLRRVDSAGKRVIIATGRPAISLAPYVDILGLPRPVPVVCFNGAAGLLMRAKAAMPSHAPIVEAFEARHKVLFTQGLDIAAASKVISVCESLGLCVSYTLPLGSVAAPKTADHEKQLIAFQQKEGVVQERVKDFKSLVSNGKVPLKIVALSSNPEATAAQARAELPEGVAHVIAMEMHVEFMAVGVNKGAALKRLCRDSLDDLPLQQIVAFGDNNNDVEMLRMVGDGVAMSNALENLKTAANRVSAWSNDEDGVARELCSLFDAVPRSGGTSE